jgi:DNA-binding NtrC family response regulator
VGEIEEQTEGEQWSRESAGVAGHGTPIILVVDDEPMVRGFTSEVLRLEGYVVLEAGGTAEGLQIAGEHRGPIDLVISDVVLPDGDNGLDLVKRLERRRPTIKSLYVSGHAEADVAGGGIVLPAFLQKPFTMDGLVNAVRRVLAAGEAAIARA